MIRVHTIFPFAVEFMLVINLVLMCDNCLNLGGEVMKIRENLVFNSYAQTGLFGHFESKRISYIFQLLYLT